MIGFGRAVGETMIVLMATGNTPVMDWSIFNGFRALSANIAVELPEAPERRTLFRVLFLAALLLFCLTFVREHRGRARAPPAPAEVPLPVRRLWRSGEPFIWLTGGALCVALLLVAGLIGLILVNGLGFFWPKDVVTRLTLRDGKVITGQLAEREPIPGKPGQYRIKLKVGQPRPLRRRLPVGRREPGEPGVSTRPEVVVDRADRVGRADRHHQGGPAVGDRSSLPVRRRADGGREAACPTPPGSGRRSGASRRATIGRDQLPRRSRSG